MCFKRSFLQLFAFVLLLIASCSKEAIKGPANCGLEAFATNGETSTYFYDHAGNVLKRILSGVPTPDTAVYSYNSSGKIKRVASASTILDYVYGSDGKVSTLTLSDGSSNLLRTEVFTWYADSVVIVYTLAGQPHPQLIRKYYFQGVNLTSQKDYLYAYSSGDLTVTQFWDYAEYDTGLNPFYLLQLQTPGLPATISKYVMKKVTQTTVDYQPGTAGTTAVTINNSYTFQNDLPLTETDSYSTGEVYSTIYTYNCNSHE